MEARKKPIEVDCVQLTTKVLSSLEHCPVWLQAALTTPTDRVGSAWVANDRLYIRTLEGIMAAKLLDYIIQGVNGELYPCKLDIFDKTYEIVDEQN